MSPPQRDLIQASFRVKSSSCAVKELTEGVRSHMSGSSVLTVSRNARIEEHAKRALFRSPKPLDGGQNV